MNGGKWLATASGDEAVRHPPCERYPWDGAGDVRPYSGFAVPIVEGVY